MIKTLCLIFIFTFSTSTFSKSEFYYRVQKGDSLTVILYSLGIFPVWDELPRVLKMNKIKVQNNPNYLWVDQKLILPEPNSVFAANYKILADNEIIIVSKIRTQKQKNDFLSRRGLKEVVPTQENPSAIISLDQDVNVLPRQIERLYFNYGLLLNSTSTEQKLPASNSISGTNSLQSINVGASFEVALRLRHHLYFDIQKFTLPTADSTMFSEDEFNLINLSYNYTLDFTQRVSLLLGVNQRERVFFTDITQDLVTVNKTSYTSASLGAMYYLQTKFFGAVPRLIGKVDYRPEISLDNKTITAGLEYTILGGAFYNLDDSSHMEVSIGASYQNYDIEDINSTDLGAKVIIKYGREFFF